MNLLFLICMVNSYEVVLMTLDNKVNKTINRGSSPGNITATSGKPITLLCRPKSESVEWNNCIWHVKTKNIEEDNHLNPNKTGHYFGEIKRSDRDCVFEVNKTGYRYQ